MSKSLSMKKLTMLAGEWALQSPTLGKFPDRVNHPPEDDLLGEVYMKTNIALDFIDYVWKHKGDL